MKKVIIATTTLLLFVMNCYSQKKTQPFVKKELLFSDTFDRTTLGPWQSELQSDSSSRVEIINQELDIDVFKGATIWLKKKFEGDIMIQYDALVIQKGGANDRVSDLNCFWMATDPRNPDDIFDSPRKPSGMFHDYDTLQLYYVGMGGHNNTKTRFRRYSGDGKKPLRPQDDLSSANVLIKANHTYNIQLIALNKTIQFIIDGEVIYDFVDPSPYREGWFAIRTISNHMVIDNVKVFRITPK